MDKAGCSARWLERFEKHFRDLLTQGYWLGVEMQAELETVNDRAEPETVAFAAIGRAIAESADPERLAMDVGEYLLWQFAVDPDYERALGNEATDAARSFRNSIFDVLGAAALVAFTHRSTQLGGLPERIQEEIGKTFLLGLTGIQWPESEEGSTPDE